MQHKAWHSPVVEVLRQLYVYLSGLRENHIFCWVPLMHYPSVHASCDDRSKIVTSALLHPLYILCSLFWYRLYCKSFSFFSKESIVILTKIDLPKSLSYGKEPHLPAHVCKISILICCIFFGVLVHCTHNCSNCVYKSMPSECKAVAIRQDDIL